MPRSLSSINDGFLSTPLSLEDSCQRSPGSLGSYLTSLHLETPSNSPITNSQRREHKKHSLPDDQHKQEKTFQGSERVKNQEGDRLKAVGEEQSGHRSQT